MYLMPLNLKQIANIIDELRDAEAAMALINCDNVISEDVHNAKRHIQRAIEKLRKLEQR